MSSLVIDPLLDHDSCYRAVESRDSRFDGWFFVAVRTTGIYCRPSCPTPIRPKRSNVDFHATAAAAQQSGFRACKRCRPDATPGSPAWDLRSDLVGRAMRLIGDGVVDRDGVPGLAERLAVSERHLHRTLTQEVGAGPLAIARANRAQTARILIETTGLKFADVAFAAGFSSVRQFNETVQAVFALAPRELRQRAAKTGSNQSSHLGNQSGTAGALTVRLAVRQPFDVAQVAGWLSYRAIAGISVATADCFIRTLRLPRGTATVTLHLAEDHVACTLDLDHVADLAVAVERCRRLLDLDADPLAVRDHLDRDKALRPLTRAHPGLRVLGSVDGFETAVFATLGQQVTVKAAVTLAGRIADRFGDSRTGTAGTPTLLFPSPLALVDADFDGLGLTTRRAATIRALANASLEGMFLEPGTDREQTREQLLAISGIGPWTADYLAMRALGDPDVLPVGDLIVRRGAGLLGMPDVADELAAHGTRWAPWRSYVAHHLWTHYQEKNA